MSSEAEGPVLIAFGSNLGDRLANLAAGIHALDRAGVPIDRFSSVVETPPVGYADQPRFLNLVASSTTRLPAGELLTIFKAVEKDIGRKPDFPNAPRTLDLDLLFVGDRIIRETGLSVPHPRWKVRSFVVEPLEEICPDLRDPETGLTVHEVARTWPVEPLDIVVVMSGNEFRGIVERERRGFDGTEAFSSPDRQNEE
jgi:2-amino-4-hydroxy-6-hydroxymethyldihydropteridine diphosphokinase